MWATDLFWEHSNWVWITYVVTLICKILSQHYQDSERPTDLEGQLKQPLPAGSGSLMVACEAIHLANS